MLVEKIIACHANQKVLLKIQDHQNLPHQFFCIGNLPSVMLPVFAFLGQKMYFLISMTWQWVVFSTGNRTQIDAVFNIKKNTQFVNLERLKTEAKFFV